MCKERKARSPATQGHRRGMSQQEVCFISSTSRSECQELKILGSAKGRAAGGQPCPGPARPPPSAAEGAPLPVSRFCSSSFLQTTTSTFPFLARSREPEQSLEIRREPRESEGHVSTGRHSRMSFVPLLGRRSPNPTLQPPSEGKPPPNKGPSSEDFSSGAAGPFGSLVLKGFGRFARYREAPGLSGSAAALRDLSVHFTAVGLSGQALLDTAKWPSIFLEGVGLAACFLSLARWVAAGHLGPSERCSCRRAAWGSGTVALGKWGEASRQISASSSSADQKIQEGPCLSSRKQFPNQGTRKGGESEQCEPHPWGLRSRAGHISQKPLLCNAPSSALHLWRTCVGGPEMTGGLAGHPISFAFARPSVWHLLLFPTNFLAAPGPGRHLKLAMG